MNQSIKGASQYNTIKYPPIFTKDGERVYRLGEPGSGDPRKINVQDYRTLRNEHLAKQSLFKDTEFKPYKIEMRNAFLKWLRPIEICKSPKFLRKEFTRFDVEQGDLGDCWFLCTLSDITMKKNVIRQVIPNGQSYVRKYAGIFRFRFWQYGKWIEVVVDDRLPTWDGNLFYASSKSKDVFWSALLEKAYAKLYGSYANIESGHCDEALLDFTGGVCEYFNFKDVPDNLFSMLLKSYERDSLLCAGTADESSKAVGEMLASGEMEEEDYVENEEALMAYMQQQKCATFSQEYDSDDEAGYADIENDEESEGYEEEEIAEEPYHSESLLEKGLVAGHAYSLTAIRYVTSTVHGIEMKVPLIRIRNPWGKTEWSGRWSDDSLEWNTVSKEEKAEMSLLHKEDGEFWMHFNDFKERFDEVYFCHWKYDHLAAGDDPNNRSWEVRTFEGEWTKIEEEDLDNIDEDDEPVYGKVCGSLEERLSKNPQFILDLVDPDEEDDDDLCTLIVALQTKHRRLSGKVASINVAIYKSAPDDPKPLTQEFFERNSPVIEPGEHTIQREHTRRYRLPPGTYYIIPSTADPNYEAKFLLRVFTEKPCALKINDDKIGTTEIDERVKDVILKQPRFKFDNMSWVELKEILNFAIVTHDENGFSKDACRSMIAMQAKDYTGNIDRIEFKALWDEICILKAIFNIYDAKNDGIIPMYNLQRALRSAGFIINEKLYNILAQRYSRSGDGNLILEDFLICALRLKKMFGTFNQKSDAKYGNCALFALDEWITNLAVY